MSRNTLVGSKIAFGVADFSDAPRLVRMEAEVPGRPVDVPADALVIRFRPTDPDQVFRRAELEFRRIGRYRLSVFAGVKAPGESDDDLKRRLVRAAGLSGINLDNQRKMFAARAEDLSGRGLVFYKDEDDDELDEHYSVDLGLESPRDIADRFLEAFGPGERRPPT